MSWKEVGKDVRPDYYPRLVVDLGILRKNTQEVMARANAAGIQVAAVIKGCGGLAPVARLFQEEGCRWIATSRLEQMRHMREEGITLPGMMIRIPMLTEIPEMVELCEVSLQSDLTTLAAANKEAGRQGKIHQVILMKDLGDLREGFWEMSELIEAAKFVESAPHLHLLGTGTNLGCYGSVAATESKMQELVEVHRETEKVIGRSLEIVSGADTTAFPRVLDGTMPAEVNSMRLGEILTIGKDLPLLYDTPTPFLRDDAWHLAAEVIEVRTKASHPIGELCVDAFGHKPVYEDIGMRKKALIAVGRADYADPGELICRTGGVRVLGASFDHTILDVTDAETPVKVGDILRFDLRYTGIVYATMGSSVAVEYVGK